MVPCDHVSCAAQFLSYMSLFSRAGPADIVMIQLCYSHCDDYRLSFHPRYWHKGEPICVTKDDPGIVVNWLGLQNPIPWPSFLDEAAGWGFVDTFVTVFEQMHAKIRYDKNDGVHSSQLPFFGGTGAPRPAVSGGGRAVQNSSTNFSMNAKVLDPSPQEHTDTRSTSQEENSGGKGRHTLRENEKVAPFGKRWLNGLYIARRSRELANIQSFLTYVARINM